MKFSADFHVHSKFSRATSQNLDIENLYIAAQMKGITVVGTGDFTHPQWISQITEKLVPAEEGLYKLRQDIAAHCSLQVPQSCRAKVRYILTTEISNIYKKNNKIRKNHNLVVVPDMASAARFSQRLAAIGNIHSDGRPILGLDAKILLEVLLETSPQSFLIPAHIWTPWFSVLGSKSGFDAIEDCFEELSEYIFAVETGLSSDPAMNWQVSSLDKYTLISNSDAHSPLNLGREANIFNTDLSYNHIFRAIKNRNNEEFLGTYEFYPQEGKYYLDGHRKCNICLTPKESIQNKGICPQCKKPLTLGVLYRVEELADRPVNIKPQKHAPFYSSIPLMEILAEIFNVGPKSKTVQNHYHQLLNDLGPEYHILHNLPEETLRQADIPMLAEAISRMRRGKLLIRPGYDGEFGKIQIFSPDEKQKYIGQKLLFDIPGQNRMEQEKFTKAVSQIGQLLKKENQNPVLISDAVKKEENKKLNREQLRAVHIIDRSVLIVAGPGTGKTLTLTHRIANLMTVRKVLPRNILAVTFTNKAAREMYARIAGLNCTGRDLPLITTFHGLCYNILKELDKNRSEDSAADTPLTIIDETDRLFFFNEAVELVKRQCGKFPAKPMQILEQILLAKQMLIEPHDPLGAIASTFSTALDSGLLSAVYGSYQQLLTHQRLFDFEDLILKAVKILETDSTARKKYQDRFQYVFVDEFQDINLGQHRLLQLLSNPGTHICVIGDPDQSIYGFRGSDVRYFQNFVSDHTDTRVIQLQRNYRSTQTIVAAARQVVTRQQPRPETDPPVFKTLAAAEDLHQNFSKREGFKTITILETASARAEAVAVGKIIESMIGGSGFHFIDFDKAEPEQTETNRSFSDFAVLYRTGFQEKIFAEVFRAAGIPYQSVNRDAVYSSKGLPETLSLLRLMAGAGSFIDLDRLKNALSPGVSAGIMKKLKTWSFENKLSLHEAVTQVRRFPVPGMGMTGQNQLYRFLDRLEQLRQETAHMAVRQLICHVTRQTSLDKIIQSDENSTLAFHALMDLSETYGRRFADFITALALQSDSDMHLPHAERVALLTMHAAKGLEFPVVFICGCEDGYIPLKRSAKEEPDTPEEIRLFYVAMTRAKERLFLTHARQRRIYGKKELRKISPFIESIESALKDSTAAFIEKKKNQIQLEMF